ncbi:putative LRR receptor-like serine/threonine-protein kinase [Senna tora]|uniref:non-specific serine/threonine protein kinase n=1 Tax=Senna tora TaxID=362788 RepID=A0A834T1Q3_9FABA|nr:putative LRR receptor-like serine/threonine-protein kinase [Senna tora]
MALKLRYCALPLNVIAFKMKKRELAEWIMVLDVFVSSSILLLITNLGQVVADTTNSSGVISIDCGVIYDNWDENSFFHEGDDARFVESGKTARVASAFESEDHQIGKQLNTLRFFPEGRRNCYTLEPKLGENNNYLIRAYYAYGNYDYTNSTPTFDFHLGVNFWSTTSLDDPRYYRRVDVIHVSPTKKMDVCLMNTGKGTPLISLLELWPLQNSVYRPISNSLPLDLMVRSSLGIKDDNIGFIRYSSDIYGRSWFNGNIEIQNAARISAPAAIDGDEGVYKLPKEVLSTAVQSLDVNSSLVINLNDMDILYEYYVYLHFYDFTEESKSQQRKMDITFTDTITASLTLEYQKPITLFQNIKQGNYFDNISIASAPGSGLPAMINAYELLLEITTVDAMRNIKHGYKITRISWQGDPCMPKECIWEGLTCNYSDSIPRVISLNLSSSTLMGEIYDSFSNLINLESLDLSNNQLTGEIPEFLAKLPHLKVLNLSGNNLTGSIPEALKDKSNTTLILSLDGNPGLCQTGSCRTAKQKSIIVLVVSVAASVAVLVIIVCTTVLLCRHKRKKQRGLMVTSSKKEGQLKSKNLTFCYSEVLGITDDFKNVIGEGGFGTVYLGTLQDGTQVAVKLLSKSSKQGFKEFQSEAELLMIVHHRNLVALVGYCDDGDMKALIYEYMAKGNLQQHLSDKNPYVLNWNERLQIALDAACGLDYLHNGCKPPIIHRDLKTSNILLSENMQAKIADFGLSRAFANDIDTHISTSPAGTFGYIDPEFHCSGNLNRKSDVYSFGIILLELLTGQPAIIGRADNAIHILQWVTPKMKNGDIQSIVDPRLEGKFSTTSAWKFLEIAMYCTPPAAIQRPDIGHIVSDLKECLALEISLETAESNSKISNTTSHISYCSPDSDMVPYAR